MQAILHARPGTESPYERRGTLSLKGAQEERCPEKSSGGRTETFALNSGRKNVDDKTIVDLFPYSITGCIDNRSTILDKYGRNLLPGLRRNGVLGSMWKAKKHPASLYPCINAQKPRLVNKELPLKSLKTHHPGLLIQNSPYDLNQEIRLKARVYPCHRALFKPISRKPIPPWYNMSLNTHTLDEAAPPSIFMRLLS
ncbi:hypothetical protein VNO77_31006 [Canavalia gladiata]|uniref:Uncharacterized protein n=1 Tax=Canavalia gladiata TaxID=3824 RepID=A0AAN9Q7J2_CANGL